MPVRLNLVVLGILLSAPIGLHAEPLADVLENMVTAYGGEENVRKLDHMV